MIFHSSILARTGTFIVDHPVNQVATNPLSLIQIKKSFIGPQIIVSESRYMAWSSFISRQIEDFLVRIDSVDSGTVRTSTPNFESTLAIAYCNSPSCINAIFP